MQDERLVSTPLNLMPFHCSPILAICQYGNITILLISCVSIYSFCVQLFYLDTQFFSPSTLFFIYF